MVSLLELMYSIVIKHIHMHNLIQLIGEVYKSIDDQVEEKILYCLDVK